MYKTIGIIGGMGALATVDMFNKIVTYTEAKNDQEHIPVLIDNNTQIPDRTSFLLGYEGDDPAKHLIRSAHKLKNSGADFILIACNTAHYFIPKIVEAVDIEIINGIKETANEVAALNYNAVAVLGTEGFVKHVNYKLYYDEVGVDTIKLTKSEQDSVSSLIYDGIKANNDIDISHFLLTLEQLFSRGAEAFILSCTELPVAFEKYSIRDYNIVDPSLIFAKRAIIKAGAQLKCPDCII